MAETGVPLGISLNDGGMDILMKSNTPLPAEVTKSYHTASAEQRLVVIKVFQGRHSTSQYNQFLGQLVLENLSRSKKHRQIRLTIKVSTTGSVSATMACDKAGLTDTRQFSLLTHQPINPVERAMKDTAELLAAITGTDMQLTEYQPGNTIHRVPPRGPAVDESADLQDYKNKIQELTEENDELREKLQNRLEAFKKLTAEHDKKILVFKTELDKMGLKDKKIAELIRQVEKEKEDQVLIMDKLQDKINQLNDEQDNLKIIHMNNIERLQKQLDEKDIEFYQQKDDLSEQIQRLNEEKKTLQLKKEMEEADLKDSLVNMRDSFQVTKKRMQEDLDKLEEDKNRADQSKWSEVAALREELQNKESEHEKTTHKLEGGISELLTAIKVSEDHYQSEIKTYAEERNNYVNLCKMKQGELNRLEQESQEREMEQEKELKRLEDEMREQNMAEFLIKEKMKKKMKELQQQKAEEIKERDGEIENLRDSIQGLKQQANDQATMLKTKIRELKEQRDLAVKQKHDELEKFRNILKDESKIHEEETRELREKLAELGDFGDEEKMKALQEQLRLKEEEYQKRSSEMQQRLMSIDAETEENIRDRDNKMRKLEDELKIKEKEYESEKGSIEKEKDEMNKRNEEHSNKLANEAQQLEKTRQDHQAELDLIYYVRDESVRPAQGPPTRIDGSNKRKNQNGAIEVTNVRNRNSNIIEMSPEHET